MFSPTRYGPEADCSLGGEPYPQPSFQPPYPPCLARLSPSTVTKRRLLLQSLLPKTSTSYLCCQPSRSSRKTSSFPCIAKRHLGPCHSQEFYPGCELPGSVAKPLWTLAATPETQNPDRRSGVVNNQPEEQSRVGH